MGKGVSAEPEGGDGMVEVGTVSDRLGEAGDDVADEQLQWAAVFSKALGQRVAALRKERGVNQDDFARSVNLHRAHMGFVEQGRSNPNLLTLLRIAEGLGVSLSELVAVDLEGMEK